jgi:hypothetical protein
MEKNLASRFYSTVLVNNSLEIIVQTVQYKFRQDLPGKIFQGIFLEKHYY